MAKNILFDLGGVLYHISYLKTIEAFQEFVGKHLFERSVFYNEAHLSIVTDNKSIVEVAIEIQKSLA